ncbi:ISKra4 family transposase, partial [Streptomyces sp. NPDC096030]
MDTAHETPAGTEDPFAASRVVFTDITDALADPGTDTWRHEQIEDFLESRGRELLRQLFQDRFGLGQRREERAHAKDGTAVVTAADGTRHTRLEPGHTRHLATVFGTVRVGRLAYRAPGRQNLYPADGILSL